jgi:2-polyprenyl-6-methoxyphenol hydroxylase-like FAD-dependent oxidoreductase
MPPGLRALETLGVLPLIPPDDCAPFRGIRYIERDGTSADGLLPGGGGLGVRRLALADAMVRRARQVGVDVRDRTEVLGHTRTSSGAALDTPNGRVHASLLVAADGLASPLRRAEGLDEPAPSLAPRRFGLRRHFRVPAWSPFVEIYFADRAEAYVTPAGRERVGVAFLWEPDRRPALSIDGAPPRDTAPPRDAAPPRDSAPPRDAPASFDALLGLFPALADRLRGAAPDSPVRGAGPLERNVKRRVAPRFVLLGDAAGYIDAITGEGLSLALTCAGALGRILPRALAEGGSISSLWPYEIAFRSAYRRYAWLTRGLLTLSRRPALRRLAVSFLARNPRVFARILDVAVG